MSWEVFTRDDVLSLMSEVGKAALLNYINVVGTDPLPPIIERVVQSFRLAIASYEGNTLGAAGTIPLSCRRHAAFMCMGDLNLQVTIGGSLQMRQAQEKAEIFLRSLPIGNPRVEHPDSPDGTFISAAPSYTAPDVSTQRTVTLC